MTTLTITYENGTTWTRTFTTEHQATEYANDILQGMDTSEARETLIHIATR